MSSYDALNAYGGLVAGAIIGSIIAVIIGIAFYVFFSFALYKLAQKRGIPNPWMAWIPIVDFYVLGQMVRSTKISTFEIPSLEIVLPIGALAVAILGRIVVLGTLISLAFYVLLFFVLLTLYKQYIPEKAMTYAVLSILGVTIPFFFLKLSKMDPVNFV